MTKRQWVVSDAEELVREYHRQMSSKGGSKPAPNLKGTPAATERARKAGKAGGRGRKKTPLNMFDLRKLKQQTPD